MSPAGYARTCLFLSVAALPGCGGCSGASGHIVESRSNTEFVREHALLVVTTERGIERIAIDGSDRRILFPQRGKFGWLVLDVSPDFRTFLLESSDTELFVGDVATGTVRSLPAAANRVSTARFSPDGKRFAAARHSDYAVKGAKEDDTIYVVDTATLATEVIAPATDRWPSTLRWATDGSGLWVSMNWSAEPEWITLPDKARHLTTAKAPLPLDEARRPPPPVCPRRAVSAKWDPTIRVLETGDSEDGGGRVVVELHGRKRGFHDYQADFSEPMLTPGCAYVVFGLHDAVWIADAHGGAAAPLLARASALFFAPSELPATDAGGALDAAPPAKAPAKSPEPSPTSRALPPSEHLLAPFRGTTAHGFVAMTNTDGATPVDARRISVALARGDALDLAKPVLVASFTKLWTAVAALRMVERKELSLDETVKDALPELASRPWSGSTVRELLTHTSLVPEFDEKSGYYRRPDVDFSAPVAVLSKDVPREWTEKRGVYKYRNAELALVGAIISARSKVPADRLLAREVFEPAGMKHAGLLVGAAPTAPTGLDLTPMGAIRPQNFFTAGAGYASANDLLSFFEALAGEALLTAASKELLFDGSPERNHGALGCWAYPFARPDGGTTRLVERPGSFGNVRLFTAFFPEERRAVVAWTGDGIEIARPRAGKGIGLLLARVAIE